MSKISLEKIIWREEKKEKIKIKIFEKIYASLKITMFFQKNSMKCKNNEKTQNAYKISKEIFTAKK